MNQYMKAARKVFGWLKPRRKRTQIIVGVFNPMFTPRESESIRYFKMDVRTGKLKEL